MTFIILRKSKFLFEENLLKFENKHGEIHFLVFRKDSRKQYSTPVVAVSIC